MREKADVNLGGIELRILACLKNNASESEDGFTFSAMIRTGLFAGLPIRTLTACMADMERSGIIESSVVDGKYHYRLRNTKTGKRYQGEHYSFDIPDSFAYTDEGERDFTAWLPGDDEYGDPEDSPVVLYSSAVTPSVYDETDSIHSKEMLGVASYVCQGIRALSTFKLQNASSNPTLAVFPIDTGDWIFSCIAIGLGTTQQHCYINVYLGDGKDKQFRVDIRDGKERDEEKIRLFLMQLMQHFHYRKAPIDLRESLLDEEFTQKPLTEETAKKWSDLLQDDLNELLNAFQLYCQKAAKIQGMLHTNPETVRARYQFDIETYIVRLERLYATTGEFIQEISALNEGNENLMLPYHTVCECMKKGDQLVVDLNHDRISCKVRNLEEVKRLWKTAENAALKIEEPMTIRDRLISLSRELPVLNAEWEKERDKILAAREQEQAEVCEKIEEQYQPQIDRVRKDRENDIKRIDREIAEIEKSNRECREELSGLGAVHFMKRSNLNQLIERNNEKLRSRNAVRQESINDYDAKLASMESQMKQEQEEKAESVAEKYLFPEQPKELISRVREFVYSEERWQKRTQSFTMSTFEKEVYGCVAGSGQVTWQEVASELGTTEQKTREALQRLWLNGCIRYDGKSYTFTSSGDRKERPLSDAGIDTAFARDRATIYGLTGHTDIYLDGKKKGPELNSFSDLRILQVMVSLTDEKRGEPILVGNGIKFIRT